MDINVLRTATGEPIVQDDSYVFQDEFGNKIRIPTANFQFKNENKQTVKKMKLQCDTTGLDVKESQMEEDDDVQFVEQSPPVTSSNLISSNEINGASAKSEHVKEKPPRKPRKTGYTKTTSLKIQQQELEHKIKMDEIQTKQRQEYLDLSKKKIELLEKIVLQGLFDF